MRVYNLLVEFGQCIRDWERLPSPAEFERRYFKVAAPLLAPMLEDWGMVSSSVSGLRPDAGLQDFYAEAQSLDWSKYRSQILGLDPAAEEKRLRQHISGVERLLGVQLGGEAVLFGAFGMMDGYARFDRGTHRVFLGVDESHGRGRYLDVLISHEITHVARESQASVWKGFGLPADLSHDDFVEKLPVIEHLFNEGFSCAVSERLAPCEEPWHYAYQTRESLDFVLEHGAVLDRVVHQELRHPDGDYGRLYSARQYHVGMPAFCHYVWAWKWVDHLISKYGDGEPARLLSRCSAEFLEDALSFSLRR